MTHDLSVTDPSELGLDADRLAAIPDYFSSYLDKGKLPCMSVLVAREGKIAHLSHRGRTSMEDGAPETNDDTIYRIYSMTKPVTSVAIMMLYERGLLQLSDPLSKFIPAFAHTRVYESGNPAAPVTSPMAREITIRDLLTHTSGLTYSFLYQNPVDQIYRGMKLDTFQGTGGLEAFCDNAAKAPLVFSPGTQWNYSIATDVLGRVVEVASGKGLDQFFREEIFTPLGMVDTGFHTTPDNADRLMACYARGATGGTALADKSGAESAVFSKKPDILSGGGGLVSTIGDYFQFCRMLAEGGELNGNRLLSPKTIEFMTENHLPGGKTIAEMGDKTFSEARMDGSGFGLGFAVTIDPVAAMQAGSVGTFSWGGMASTFFWIDPAEDLIVIQMTQLMPSGAYPIRPQLHQLVYAAITA